MKKIKTRLKTRLGFFREYTTKGKWRGAVLPMRYTENKFKGTIEVFWRTWFEISKDWSALHWLTR